MKIQMLSLLMSVAVIAVSPAFAMDEENGAPKTLPAASFKLNLSEQQVMDLLSSGDDNPQTRSHLGSQYKLSSCIGHVQRDIPMDFSGKKKPLSSKPTSSVAKPSVAVAVDLAIKNIVRPSLTIGKYVGSEWSKNAPLLQPLPEGETESLREFAKRFCGKVEGSNEYDVGMVKHSFKDIPKDERDEVANMALHCFECKPELKSSLTLTALGRVKNRAEFSNFLLKNEVDSWHFWNVWQLTENSDEGEWKSIFCRVSASKVSPEKPEGKLAKELMAFAIREWTPGGTAPELKDIPFLQYFPITVGYPKRFPHVRGDTQSLDFPQLKISGSPSGPAPWLVEEEYARSELLKNIEFPKD